MLLTARERVRLVDHQLLIVLKTVAVAVRADMHFSRNNRVTTSANLILRRVADNAASAFFAFLKCWIKVCHTAK